MKRLVLVVLLGLSLAANAWFLRAGRASSPGNSPAAPAAVATTTTSRAAAPIKDAETVAAAASEKGKSAAALSKGFVWRAPKSDDDFRRLADELRAAGVPSRLIYAVVQELYSARELATSPLASAPYWQRRVVEQSKEMQEIYRRIEAKAAEFAGPDGRLSARLDPVARARRYGDLPDAKIDAIAALERDYSEMVTDSYRATGNGAFTAEEWAAKQKEQKLLTDEKRADLAKILTPDELAAYDLRNSDTARQVASSVRNIDLRPDEFATLYAARQAFDAANPQLTGLVTSEMMQQRRAAQTAYNEAVKGVLNDDRFYQYLAATDADYRTALNLSAKYPQVTAPVAYQVSSLKAELEATRTTLFRSTPPPDAITAAYAGWNNRLDALLGSAAAAEFRQTQTGRVFNPPTIRRTTSPAAAVPPRP
ncbi:MAG: hypothetical protein KF715_11200 [Candidatus Didemnitutus sp.]|nr:hypothetical protein [Candidatus Didemnitutus sp.]